MINDEDKTMDRQQEQQQAQQRTDGARKKQEQAQQQTDGAQMNQQQSQEQKNREQMNQQQSQGQKNKPQMNMPKFNMNWIYGIVILTLFVLYFTQGSEKSSVRTETSYSDFKVMVQKGYAEKIVVSKYNGTLQMYVKLQGL